MNSTHLIFFRKRFCPVWLLLAFFSLLVAGIQAQDDFFSAQPFKETDSEKIVTTPSGLKYIDYVVGSGSAVSPGKRITLNYVGKLEDGKIFDSSLARGKPFSFVLGVSRMIKGWEEGVSSMKEGGKRRLIIPPSLGYGTEGVEDVIPPNATLIFDIEVLKVE
ncbi:FKBP-type peptidyl-prolyl cis-trans isomerase [Candidatus Methylacidiphilum infernorum]|uniref:Peptidyl-prolyl cis-trans isomerase n=1 Tax=Methylacidiphilum infernorum (isolate V4) TaxID=481448 RepID=B3DYT4_METI4|nr:FKBP-type peptidyl-prolyl cis-trans isomerase [Candidatus Methylacidiphilum infernorum]ACD82456.1 FKBP-type peptidyl-prolyl cis-trans isomerase [Methylacidiphilum infernorum V4]